MFLDDELVRQAYLLDQLDKEERELKETLKEIMEEELNDIVDTGLGPPLGSACLFEQIRMEMLRSSSNMGENSNSSTLKEIVECLEKLIKATEACYNLESREEILR